MGQLGENVAASLHKGARAIVNGRLEQRSWETQDGEKRSKIEVVADEIGPSLRWATAQVERTARTDRRRRPAGGAVGGGRRRRRRPAVPPSPPYGDEEPF